MLYVKYSPQEKASPIAGRITSFSLPNMAPGSTYIAEPELSVMTRKCFAARVGSQELASERIQKWYQDWNQRQKGNDWQFTNEKAKTKLTGLNHPKIELS